ncbi:transcriptional regulator [Domibacillus aminovorans]|uniref:Transcriptional regulator n=1 Tax=Domibacillus aminovorans TaxID=29332 RepID=A0A177KL50_9BACI|nr:helix-turn-helix transcriptional regulator [Domibacillus aminovorans]OAH53864.1 transcriptional regulator [Domibacillus aminovorans]
MTIGRKIADARKRTGHSQRSLSEMEEVAVSKESIAKYEKGTRTFPKDMYPRVAGALDDPQFYFETWQETTGYVSIPYFNGAVIDRHPAAMVHLVKSETVEAIDQVEMVCWYKPSENRTEHEKEDVRQVIKELLDAAASMINLAAELCKDNGFSMKSLFREWRVSLKARKYER